ncbi:MAG: tetratricopeptide repeat protein [Cytophagales bacterium]|nr:tetratricopeptide repeat protein [Armatimonadota bacterium]
MDEAIDAYRSSLRVVTAGSDTYAGLADALAAKGLYEEAIQNYQEALGLVPGRNWSSSRQTDGDLHMRFALLLSKLGRHRDAVLMYQAGRSLMPSYGVSFLPTRFTSTIADKRLLQAAAHAAIGNHYSHYGRSAEALEELRIAESLRPDSAPILFYLGNFQYTMGSRAKARPYFQKVKELGEGDLKKEARERLGEIKPGD